MGGCEERTGRGVWRKGEGCEENAQTVRREKWTDGG